MSEDFTIEFDTVAPEPDWGSSARGHDSVVKGNLKKVILGKPSVSYTVEKVDETRVTEPTSVSNHSTWTIYQDRIYSPAEKTTKTLPAMQFTFESTDSGPVLMKREINTDEIIPFSDGDFSFILNEIDKFQEAKPRFEALNLLWKRGILLWGPPGSGKTCLVQSVSEKITQAGGIAIYISNPSLAARGLKMVRMCEPDRLIVAIIEDIDAVVSYSSESELLSLLDGELQVDNIMFIATTNYPEKLDKRIINRPSRFDIVKYIGMPGPTMRREYLVRKNPMLDAESLDYWVNHTEGLALAHLREVIVSVECLGNTFDDTIARMRKMMTDKPSSDKYNFAGGSFGFTSQG